MTRIRNKYKAQKKVKMILEGIAHPDGIQAYCRQQGIRDALFYKWEKQLVENAVKIFDNNKKAIKREQRIQELLAKKDKIISELVEENIDLKKKAGDRDGFPNSKFS